MERDDALALLDDLPDGVVLLDGGAVRYLNRAAAALLEVDAERVRGLPLIAVVRDHRLERAALDGEAVEVETRGRRVLASPVRGGLLLRDVTELRGLQREARELLAVLSHELRTPATAIRSTLEALRYDLPEAQRERFVAQAEAEMARLVRLLEDLTVDTRPPRLRRLDLAEVARRAASVLGPLLAERGVRLGLDGLPAVTVLADEDKLLQVLLNLVENAARHGPADAAVDLVARPDDDGRLTVCVLDRGAPLPADAFEALFRPHARGGAAKARGTGLGLYIVRSIARQWGGEARGEPWEEGNAFSFTVPLAPR